MPWATRRVALLSVYTFDNLAQWLPVDQLVDLVKELAAAAADSDEFVDEAEGVEFCFHATKVLPPARLSKGMKENFCSGLETGLGYTFPGIDPTMLWQVMRTSTP